MSFREEDRRKNSSTSRGLGLAAAAIGVGVGAALYYIFSKRQEQPDSEGATSDNWTTEEPQTFHQEEQMRIRSEKAFRERKWSLEECAICFDVMLRDQQLMTLPCTHNFHVACIGPWIQERHNCPVCRKPIEG